MLRIDCGEFVRQRSEEERKRERIHVAHIRCRGCHGANEVAKKEGREKESRRSGVNGERLKCNEVQSKKDDLIYLQKNKATLKATRRAR